MPWTTYGKTGIIASGSIHKYLTNLTPVTTGRQIKNKSSKQNNVSKGNEI